MPNWGNTAASTGSGAAAGAAVGGPWGAVIGAGVGLVGSLLGDSAEQERRKKELLMGGINQSFDNQKQASANLSDGEQQAMNQLLSSYKASTS